MASEALATCEWIGFFKDAGIPSWSAFNYAVTFMENRIQKNMLIDLNKEIINELGITIIGDVIAILKHAKIVHRQECSRHEGVYPEPMDQSGATLSPDSSGDANLMGSKGNLKAGLTYLPGTIQETLTSVTDYSLGIAEPEDITKQADLSGDLNPFWGSVEYQNPYQEPSPPDENMRSGHHGRGMRGVYRAAPSPFRWYRGGRGGGPPYRGRGSGPPGVEYEEEHQGYGPGGDKSHRSVCRHFSVRGSCRFEMNCNFYHPGINGPPLP